MIDDLSMGFDEFQHWDFVLSKYEVKKDGYLIYTAFQYH